MSIDANYNKNWQQLIFYQDKESFGLDRIEKKLAIFAF